MRFIKKATKEFLYKQAIMVGNLLHKPKAWRKSFQGWIHEKVWITRIKWGWGIIQARCKEHWYILIIGGVVILVILAAIFPFSSLSIIEGLLYVIAVYLFRPHFPLKRDTLVKMDNIIKYTCIIGLILFIIFWLEINQF